MTALIFGANGQDGHFMKELLLANDVKVFGVSRSGDWIKGDVGDYGFVKDIIKKNQPDYIFHLAANSTTSHDTWEENHRTICNGTLYILESVKQLSSHTKVFISGSGLQFKNEGRPIKETDDFFAGSPYALSRIHSVHAARYYRSIGIATYVGYFFNHESPMRSERHMSKKIAIFAKKISGGADEKLAIGAINVKKEWTYAADAVDAVWKLVTQDNVFESVIGSGKAYSIQEWLDLCFGLINKDWKHHVINDHDFQPEYKLLVSDPATIQSIGWEQKISFSDLAGIMMQ